MIWFCYFKRGDFARVRSGESVSSFSSQSFSNNNNNNIFLFSSNKRRKEKGWMALSDVRIEMNDVTSCI